MRYKKACFQESALRNFRTGRITERQVDNHIQMQRMNPRQRGVDLGVYVKILGVTGQYSE